MGATAGPGRATGTVEVTRIAGADRIGTAVAVSRSTHERADVVVLARSDQFADALAAAPLAAHLGGPLLLTPGDVLPPSVRAEIDRLGAVEVVLLGGLQAISAEVAADLASDHQVRRISGPDRFATAADVAGHLPPADGVIVVSGAAFADALSAAPLAAHLGWPLLLTWPDRLDRATADVLRDRAPSEVLVIGGTTAIAPSVLDDLGELAPSVRRISGPDRYATGIAVHREAVHRGMGDESIWLASGQDFPDALAAGAAVAGVGASLLLVDGSDLREPLRVARHLREAADRVASPLAALTILGGPRAVTAAASWQLAVVLDGTELPRGGFTLFPRHRMVAFYGNHTASAMGVLGEQPPDEAYERLWRQAAPFEAGGRAILPTFELIVSVATRGPGGDGDYSSPSSPDKIQPWLDAARRHGVYLLLDLQTGRSDFLSDAKRYEQFLRQPDVGLALDPEWRMDADEVPGQSVGEVHADEVNAVAAWLAELVRAERLPQKLLVVHQFQTRMVEAKASIVDPPELAVLFHMDGHGSRAQKRRTYAAVSDSTGHWDNGFKLFYDEDSSLYSPGELLAEIRPLPDLVSYQ